MTISRARRMANVVRSIVEQADPAGELTLSGSGTQPYTNIADLPLTGNTTGAEAFVSENNRLYIWNGTGWYNIALVNTSPTAITGADGSYAFATDGTPIEITLVSTDPEGIPITWSYAVTSGSLTNGGGTTATVSQAANVFTITPSTNEDYVGSFGLTFTASDGVNLATATSSFTLQFRILNSKYTTLMLKAESSGSNTTFVDSSPNNFTITRNGDVTQGTFGPYSRPEGAWSNYFDGSGDYLQIPYSTSTTQWWLQDFTIEMWVYNNTNSVSGTDGLCLQLTHGVATMATTYWSFGTNATGKVEFYYYNGGGVRLTSAASVPLSSWNHISMVYTNSTGNITLYLNGTSVASGTKSGTPQSSGSSALNLGVAQNTYYNGYISNARVIQGTALYTSNFTPPTDPLTAIAGTSLLTCQTNRFKDNSTNNFAITVNGDTKVTTFGPYDQMAYDPAVNGGSAYFDGSGDYLSTAANAAFDFGTGDFTIECWVWPVSNGQNFPTFLSSVTGWSAGASGHRFNNTGYPNKFWFGLNGSGGIASGDPFMVSTNTYNFNTWHHYAITRSGNTWRMFVNGSLENTQTYTGSYNCGLGGLRSGWSTWDGANGHFTGFVSNLRIIKGTALYASAFNPPTEPLTAVAGTSLLLKYDNGSIVDYSGNNNLAVIGNTAVNTTTKKYAAGSVYFDGNGDYLTASPGPNFAYGTGNFTIEAWVYPQSFASEPMIWSQTADGQNYFLLYITSGGTPSFRFGSGGGTAITSSVAILLNAWSHVSVVREGTGTNQLKVYVNGVQTAVGTCAWDFTNTTYIPTIGRYTHTASLHFTGYIEDVRVTKGLARYTANFTPPTSELSG